LKHERSTSKAGRVAVAALLGCLALGAMSGSAFAGKPSGGGGQTTSTSTLTLIPLDSTDGVARWGQNVTFEVKTTVTTKPYVSLECTQAGATVYSATAGFFADYPWPSKQVYSLWSDYWTGGAANCVAKAYYAAGHNKFPTLATTSFTVQA
jgi:hypothetical protein